MKRKWMLTGAAAIFLVSSSAGVYAGAQLQEIKAYLDSGMKFQMDGKPFQPVNDKGAVMAPISYNNSTYLPVRAISNALGVAVSYDSATHTVILGEKTEGVSIAGGFRDHLRTKDPDLTSYQGKDYKDVFLNNLSGNRSASFMLYPEGKYQKLYLQVAAIGQDIEEFFVKDSDTDVKLEIDSVSISDSLKTFEIDISGVDSLYVHAKVQDGGSIFVPLTTSYYK